MRIINFDLIIITFSYPGKGSTFDYVQFLKNIGFEEYFFSGSLRAKDDFLKMVCVCGLWNCCAYFKTLAEEVIHISSKTSCNCKIMILQVLQSAEQCTTKKGRRKGQKVSLCRYQDNICNFSLTWRECPVRLKVSKVSSLKTITSRSLKSLRAMNLSQKEN